MKPIVMNHRASVILILLIVLEVFWSIHNFFFFWKSSYWRLIISFKSSKNFILNPVFFTCRIKLYQWNPFNITNYYLKISLKKKGNENLKTQIGIRQCNTSKTNPTHVNARYYINLKINEWMKINQYSFEFKQITLIKKKYNTNKKYNVRNKYTIYSNIQYGKKIVQCKGKQIKWIKIIHVIFLSTFGVGV